MIKKFGRLLCQPIYIYILINLIQINILSYINIDRCGAGDERNIKADISFRWIWKIHQEIVLIK